MDGQSAAYGGPLRIWKDPRTAFSACNGDLYNDWQEIYYPLFPLPPLPFPFPPFPSPSALLPLEVGTLDTARGYGGAL